MFINLSTENVVFMTGVRDGFCTEKVGSPLGDTWPRLVGED